MDDEMKPKTNRDGVLERLKKRKPDGEWLDDEALYGQISADYDEYENSLSKYKDQEEKLMSLFNSDPRNAQFFTEMARGEDPWINVIKRLGIDGITDLINDPEKQEEYANANKEYVERIAESKRLEEEYQANFSKSLQMLESMQAEEGISDEQMDAAFELLDRIARNALSGIVEKDTVHMMLKAINHDADVEAATSEGVISGKNAKIEEKLRKQKQGDGTPVLQGNNNMPKPKRKKSIFDYAMEAN